MTAYAFEALDAEGKTVKDLIDADSAKAATTRSTAPDLIRTVRTAPCYWPDPVRKVWTHLH